MKNYQHQEEIEEGSVWAWLVLFCFEHHYNQDADGQVTDSTIAARKKGGEPIDARQFITSVIGQEEFENWLNYLDKEVEENWQEPDELSDINYETREDK